MEENSIKQYQIKYFENINESLDIQQLSNMIQFKAAAIHDKRSLFEREKDAKKRMINSIKMRACDTEKVIEDFEQYGKVMQNIYFEIGVQIGICLQAELLLKHSEESKKENKMMTVEEFKEHLFDVINESNELLIEDIEADPTSNDIVVTVFDGSEFIVRCERRQRGLF